jgi:predicted cupin superfamily sugar epimerase
VKAGFYKATTLINGDYGLLGEAVAPGFEYVDNQTFSDEGMADKFPHLKDAIFRK